jgi:hypothetical protein
MSRQLFVWRMTPGLHAGAPCEHPSGHRDIARTDRESRHPEQGPIDGTGALAAEFDGLAHGRLRCGWWTNSVVDWRPDEQISVEHDRTTCQNDWSLDPETSHAVGSRHLWCCLREMSAGDVMFLPKSPDDGHFLVATVKRPDACDRATMVGKADGLHDGDPLIGMADTMRYAYGVGTLYPYLLEPPRHEAIQRISEDNASYQTLAEFLRSWSR